MDVDIKIPIEKVEKLPEKFSKMIQSPPSIEKACQGTRSDSSSN